MKNNPHANLSRRERQIMDALYRRGRATAAEIREEIPAAPGYSAVRAMLRVLEEKGHVRHEEEALRYVFLPTAPRRRAVRAAVEHLVETFFEGSTERAVAALDPQNLPSEIPLTLVVAPALVGVVRAKGAPVAGAAVEAIRAIDHNLTLNGFPFHDGVTGVPILDQAPSYVECEVRQAVDCGGHTLFVGEVVDCAFQGPEDVEVLRMEDTRMSYGG